MFNSAQQDESKQDFVEDIAIIGMVGRFPDANDIDTFWHNLTSGVESVKIITGEELRERGFGQFVDENPNYISAEASLSDDTIRKFDAAFFNISPREAEIMDPQHRLFLESCWELFEKSGYSMEHYDGRVGVIGSTGFSGYLESHLLPNRDLLQQVGSFQTQLGNDKDFIATRVSYKMGFTGASLSVSTLCSSAAVAIHMARESLLNYQNDLVLAGGVNISVSNSDSLYYQEGGIGAGDGKCRAYDERASGTVAGSGLGIIALKRLEDAQNDGDTILAVIKGSAVNNDGSDKASYTAPSPEGQAQVISEALAVADLSPETIRFIDGHGTATNIGDPIEISALTKAYRQHTDKKQFCGIGSVKTNIGHLVTAGGIASVIKMVLALKHKKMPPSLNFEKPNPKIDFANSPFYVNDTLKHWEADEFPRRGAISSFGIGGTNVHIILEEAPEPVQTTERNGAQAILLSAKTELALAKMKRNLLHFIEENPNVILADLAYTLKVGRNTFEHKFYAVCESLEQLKEQLSGVDEPYTKLTKQKQIDRNVCFIFPGQGSQYQSMAKQLYENEPVYRQHLDHCLQLASDSRLTNLKQMLFPSVPITPCPLKDTQYAQITLFCIEYSLAQLWMVRGITPHNMIGHSLGELTAACIAGVFTLEDAVKLVCERGRLMSEQPRGVMLSVGLSEMEVQPYLVNGVELAAVNGAKACVLSGNCDAIDSLEAKLHDSGTGAHRLKTSHAFHSESMTGAQAGLVKLLTTMKLNPPTLPFVSNVTGDWITEQQATSPEYWGDQLRSTVKYYQGMELILEDQDCLMLEVGPGSNLSTFASMAGHNKDNIISYIPGYKDADLEPIQLELAHANLWASGIFVNWSVFYESEIRQRLHLPTYSFDRKTYWVEAVPYGQTAKISDLSFSSEQAFDDFLVSNQQDLKIGLSLELKLPFDNEMKTSQRAERVFALRQEIVALCEKHQISSTSDSNISPVLVSKERKILQSYENEETQSIESEYSKVKSFLEPTNELEKSLVQDWETALGTSPIGIDDDFFELNGHSLIAATLVNKIKQQYGVEVGLRDFLDGPTIAGVAEVIATKQWLLQEENTEELLEEHGDTLLL